MSKTRKLLTIVIGLALAVAAGAVSFMLLHDGGSNRAENPDAVATVAAEAFTEESAIYLEEKLNSQSKEEQALALVPMMRTGEWDSNALFPEGAILQIDDTSFEGNDEGSYTVQASIVRGEDVLGTYALYVVYVESENAWLIAGTTKIEGE